MLPLGEWLTRYAVNERGRPYDAQLYPHFTAPGGPCEAYDDPLIRDIDLEFGSRLGKTFWGTSTLLYKADVDPAPALFSSATEKIALRNVERKIYPMIAGNPRLADQLLPEHRRNQYVIALRWQLIYIGWGGSVAALADLDARYGHASEVDKWDRTAKTAQEGDTLDLWGDRFKNHWGLRKRIRESTPQTAELSRIDRLRKEGDNRSLYVPCPHCGTRQVLRTGPPGEGLGGLRWDKGPSGHSDKLTAWATARYVCAHCQRDILDEHRPAMMRAGIWAPEGCTVQRGGHVVGTPLRSGYAASFQLSSHYSLLLSWGDLASEFVGSKDDPAKLQNWTNQWEAVVWVTTASVIEPGEVARRWSQDYPLGTVPPECLLLTAGVDKQLDHFVYSVWGWCADQRGYLITYGTTTSADELIAILRRKYLQPATGKQLVPRLSLIDSGFEPDEIYKLCLAHNQRDCAILPAKGGGELEGEKYRLSKPKTSRKHLRPGAPPRPTLCWLNTNYWQAWIQRLIDHGQGGHPASLATPAEIALDDDFWAQLCNENRATSIDRRNYSVSQWQKLDPNAPNDLRDTVRYARCAIELALRQNWKQLAPAAAQLQAKTTAAQPANQPRRPAPTNPTPKPAALPRRNFPTQAQEFLYGRQK